MAIRKMSTSTPSSDSLAKCDPGIYTDFYDPRKKVDLRVPNTPSLPKDTLQVCKEKLKQEALSCLRHKSKIVILQTGFMRIGKVVFLAVALPPYFVIVGIPKWLMMQALPFLFKTASQAVEKIKGKIQKRVQAVIQKMVQKVMGMQQAVQKLLSPVAHLLYSMSQAYRHFHQKVRAFLIRIKEKGKGALRLRDKIKKRTSLIKGKIHSAFSRLQEGTLAIKEWLAYPLHKIANFQISLQVWSTKVQNLCQERVQTMKQKFQLAQHLTLKCQNWFERQGKQAKQLVLHVTTPFRDLLNDYVRPGLKKIASFFKEKQKRNKEFCRQKKEQLLAFLQKKQLKIKTWPVDHFSAYLHSLSHSQKLPLFIRQLLKKASESAFIRTFLPKLLRSLRGALAFLFLGLGQTIRGLAWLLDFFKKGRTQTLEIFFKALAPIKKGIHFFNFGIQKGCYCILLAMAMLAILLGWGVELLAQITNRIIKKKLIQDSTP